MAQWIPRKGWFIALITLSIITTLGLLFFDYTFVNKLRLENLAETVAVMRTRLKFLESQYRGTKQELLEAQERIDSECKNHQGNHPTGNDVANATFSPAISALLKKMSGGKASDGLLSSDKPELIKAPFSLKIIPHLMDNPESLRPAYLLRSQRHYSEYIIGVTHVKREKETYLFDTLRFLLKMSETDKNSTTIVVMIGETNMTYVLETAHKIEEKFSHATSSGLIEVLSPNEHYYPDLDTLPQTLGDSMKRVKWRSKQNLDVLFLMAYAQDRCLYFLMLEDDVLAEDNYMTEIRKYTTRVTVENPDWFLIQYSTTGAIGKLFRSTDLTHFMAYIQLFYYNMPIDWLTESYLINRVCGMEKTVQECVKAKNKIRPTYKKDLFKHIGLYSSLNGKMQKVKFAHRLRSSFVNMSKISPEWAKWASKSKKRRDLHAIQDTATANIKLFDFFPHINPAVSMIKCDLQHHANFTIQNAYEGKSYFWAKIPKKDDVIEFWFETPGNFDRYLIRSGSWKHVNDKISNAVFEILPVSNTRNGTFVTIDHFDEFGMVEGQVDTSKYGELYAMRIRFATNGRYWVAITEIEFVTMEDAVNMRNRLSAKIGDD